MDWRLKTLLYTALFTLVYIAYLYRESYILPVAVATTLLILTLLLDTHLRHIYSRRFKLLPEEDRELLIAYGVSEKEIDTSKLYIPSIALFIVSTTLYIYTGNPAVLILNILPLTYILYRNLRIRVKPLLRREERLNLELPILLLYIDIYSRIGRTLDDVYRQLYRQTRYMKLRVEAGIYLRLRRLYSLEKTIQLMTRDVGDRLYKSVLIGYLAVLNSGGDISSYIEKKLEKTLDDMHRLLSIEGGRLVEIGSFTVGLITLLAMTTPLIMIFTYSSIDSIILIAFTMVLATVYMLLKAKTIYNLTTSTVKTGYKPYILATATALPILFITQNPTITYSTAFLTFLTALAIYTYPIESRLKKDDLEAIEFFRMYSEYLAMGYQPVEAILHACRYSREIDSYKEKSTVIEALLKKGYRYREIITYIQPLGRIEQLIHTVIETSIDIGGLTAENIEKLVIHIEKLDNIYREIENRGKSIVGYGVLGGIAVYISTIIYRNISRELEAITSSTQQLIAVPLSLGNIDIYTFTMTLVAYIITTASAYIYMTISSTTYKDYTKLALAVAPLTTIILLSHILTTL